MYTVRATRKLLDRVKQPVVSGAGSPTSMLGDWYATWVGWRPQTVLVVNEATLVSVLLPLAPARSLLERFPEHLTVVLRALEVPEGFVVQELAVMGDGVFAKTADRSLVGTMNELALLADARRARGRTDDLVEMSVELATVPCSRLRTSEGFPDRELAALVERWRAGELTPPAPSAAPSPTAAPSPPSTTASSPPSPEPPVRPSARNRVRPDELSVADVEAALERIAGRDEGRAGEAEHVFDALTWGEGPGQLNRAGVQNWLWYELGTKYLVDDPGHMGRLAEAAAELFDMLGLDGYAGICCSVETALVHAAYDRSTEQGLAAMRRALEASGVEPPDTASWRWGQVMGMEEASARSSVELTLEDALDTGDLVVGARGWRTRQRELTDAALDTEHPAQPGQTWRSAITTERLGSWIDEAAHRSAELGRLRSGVANRLLHPIEAPRNLAAQTRPVSWLLERFGDSQGLTQAGYLNRAFVHEVYEERPWADPYDTGRAPRTETDEITLHRLRAFLERAGALRKRGAKLERTRRGAAMVDDPAAVWSAVVDHLSADPWSRFVVETTGLVQIDRAGPVRDAELWPVVRSLAAEVGWRLDADGSVPSERAVSWAFSDSGALLELFGLLEEHGDWTDHRLELTPAGESTLLAMLRSNAVGPRDRP